MVSGLGAKGAVLGTGARLGIDYGADEHPVLLAPAPDAVGHDQKIEQILFGLLGLSRSIQSRLEELSNCGAIYLA
jgi:hypothetical protein